ncbi:MFS transporter [Cognatishimia sp. 1_MG-2023]|uniref:MFS transporter n=1 Tax=Cognatishimia sp. 1_MG-2023 TaxID=3062642 RepID=UPI0026E3035A|nr:MFS transporter [Cognatishimia sp. 1_MG-2023]MDO6727200.1 MFS transporter [Cognatishimia sp. 1_MG-2023]
MTQISSRRRIWGWFFFDWASQPFATLLLTFIFAPYFKELMGSGAEAQSAWGLGVGMAGIVIALLAPILGAAADISGNRMRWIWLFSILYVVGSFGLWFAAPDSFNPTLTLVIFAIGLFGAEFATIFTNSMLPDLGSKEEIGRISGNGWAFGYLGGLIALILMLALLAENAETGKTMIGISPILGLDAAAREGTRAVGPLTAIWFMVFMVPFFLWVRDPKPTKAAKGALKSALRDVAKTVRSLPKTPSLFSYLGSSMLYRDGLSGMYTFGGIYAAGVLNWSVPDIGTFAIIAIVAGAIFAKLGGWMDDKFGPRPVIIVCIAALAVAAITIVFISRDSVFRLPVAEGSKLPDIAFYIVGAVIGAAGGALQSASRTMMVRQANPNRMTEAFGLYALAGKATGFLAPLSIGIVTSISDSQQIGITPLIVLFVLGFLLLFWVKPEGDRAVWDDSSN